MAARCRRRSSLTPANLLPAATAAIATRNRRIGMVRGRMKLFLEPVHGLNYCRDALKVSAQQVGGLDLPRLGTFFANIQQFVERRSIETEALAGSRDNLPLGGGRLDSVQNQGMAEQHAERGE